MSERLMLRSSRYALSFPKIRRNHSTCIIDFYFLNYFEIFSTRANVNFLLIQSDFKCLKAYDFCLGVINIIHNGWIL